MSVGATVGVELLATTHAAKHMANVLPNLVLVMRWQRLEILVTDITEVNPVSLCFSLIPSSNYMNSPTRRRSIRSFHIPVLGDNCPRG